MTRERSQSVVEIGAVRTPAESADVVIVGGGLAGLTLAIQLKQARPATSVVVLEKREGPAPRAAFKVGEKTADPLAMYLSDIYTISCNLAGIAGLSLPCGFTKSGLPIGLQLQAPPFAEEKLLRVARMYEAATDWHTRRAKLG